MIKELCVIFSVVIEQNRNLNLVENGDSNNFKLSMLEYSAFQVDVTDELKLLVPDDVD